MLVVGLATAIGCCAPGPTPPLRAATPAATVVGSVSPVRLELRAEQRCVRLGRGSDGAEIGRFGVILEITDTSGEGLLAPWLPMISLFVRWIAPDGSEFWLPPGDVSRVSGASWLTVLRPAEPRRFILAIPQALAQYRPSDAERERNGMAGVCSDPGFWRPAGCCCLRQSGTHRLTAFAAIAPERTRSHMPRFGLTGDCGDDTVCEGRFFRHAVSTIERPAPADNPWYAGIPAVANSALQELLGVGAVWSETGNGLTTDPPAGGWTAVSNELEIRLDFGDGTDLGVECVDAADLEVQTWSDAALELGVVSSEARQTTERSDAGPDRATSLANGRRPAPTLTIDLTNTSEEPQMLLLAEPAVEVRLLAGNDDCCGCPMTAPPIEVPEAFEVDELVRVEAGGRVALPAKFGRLPDRLQAEMLLQADPEAGETWPELLEPDYRLPNLRCVPQPGPVAFQAALRALPVPFVRYDPADPEFEEAKMIPGARLRGRYADGPLFVDIPVETWEEREGVRIWRQSLDGSAPPILVSDIVEICLDPMGEVCAEASGP